MRIRSVKPEFWRDAVTGEMDPTLALFYIGLSCFADDGGRFEWDARLLRADLDPFDAKFGGIKGIERLLDRLAESGRIVPYTANGKKHGEIPSFAKHQHPKKPSLRCPVPVGNQYGTGTEPVPAGRGEGRGEEVEEEGAEPSSPPSPVVAVMPCVGHGPPEYGVTQAEVDAWIPAYPGIDVRTEVLKAKAWLEANPTKRKTHGGIPRFLVHWLNRAQDGAKGKPGATPDIRVGSAPAQSHEVFKAGGGGVKPWA